MPFTNPQGEISPRKVWLPTASEFDPNTAFVFNAGNLDAPPRYDQVDDRVVNVVRYEWDVLNLVWFSRVEGTGDRLASAVQPAARGTGSASRMKKTRRSDFAKHDNVAELGPREVTYDLSGFSPQGEGRNTGGGVVNPNNSDGLALESAIRELRRETFDRRGDSAPLWYFTSFEKEQDGQGRIPRDLQPGDLVILNHPLQPNPALNTRGGNRVVQLIEKRPGTGGIDWVAEDAGPNLQPLTTPSVAIALSGTNPRHEAQLTVSGVPAGAEATVELALGAGQPFTVLHDGKGKRSVRCGRSPVGDTDPGPGEGDPAGEDPLALLRGGVRHHHGAGSSNGRGRLPSRVGPSRSASRTMSQTMR